MNAHRFAVGLAALIVLVAPVASAMAGSGKSKVIIPLLRAGSDDDVSGEADFRSALGKSRFKLKIKHAEPAEMLDVVVGGVTRATVVTSAVGKAVVEFRTGPLSGSKLRLDFEPRGKIIEINDVTGKILDNRTDDGSNPPGSTVDEGTTLAATGVQPGAEGEARLRERKGVRKFKVEIEDVASGSYDLLVDGLLRGTITAVGGRGEIEFASPSDDPGKLPLTFDPFGKLVQIAQGSDIVLTGSMLAPAPGVNVCTPSETITVLGNMGPDPDASGDARLRVREDCRRDFRVEVEDLPVGGYELVVGETVRGTINVTTSVDGGTEGEIEFSTNPDQPGKLLLDFDPVGQTIEVRQGGTVFLSSTVSPPLPGSCGLVEVEPPLANTGADADAKGKARFRQEADCDRDFRVQVENLSVGNYELAVGGITRGTIVVAFTNGEARGEIEFDNEPDQPGEVLLNFDPRGQLIEVRQAATVFLTLTFPG